MSKRKVLAAVIAVAVPLGIGLAAVASGQEPSPGAATDLQVQIAELDQQIHDLGTQVDALGADGEYTPEELNQRTTLLDDIWELNVQRSELKAELAEGSSP